MPPRLAIIGYGKMGRAIETLALERGWPAPRIISHAEASSPPTVSSALDGADVAIEFTEPSAAATNIRAALAAGCPIVVGTTGWYSEIDAITAETDRVGGALLWAPNFSLGVQLFLQIATEAAKRFARLGAFDAHITETHHSAKKDAPSGTGAALERAVAESLGRQVPITSIRTGYVPGTHELIFNAPFEQVVLRHEARDRRVFADGALRAAEWLIGRRGVFQLHDMLANDTELK